MELTPLRVTSGADFSLVGEIDEYASLRWVRRWQRAGEVELTLNYNMPYADKLMRGNIIEYGDLTAIIDNVVYDQKEGGKGAEQLTVRAKSTATLIDRFVTKPPPGEAYRVASGPSESVMKTFVMAALSGLTNFTVAMDKRRGAESAWQTRYDNLAALLEEMSIVTGLGWDVSIDYENGLFVFEVLEGVSRIEVSDNPVIFSPDYDNLKVVSYEESDRDYKNVAIVGGQGEGAARTIVEVAVGSPSGLDRREVFVDARDLDTVEGLTNRGLQTLAQSPVRRTLTADILTNSITVYQKDWDMGDVVVVQNTNWGVSMNAQIIEVTESVDDMSGRQLSAVFGTGVLRLSQAIKRETAKAEKEVKK